MVETHTRPGDQNSSRMSTNFVLHLLVSRHLCVLATFQIMGGLSFHMASKYYVRQVDVNTLGEWKILDHCSA